MVRIVNGELVYDDARQQPTSQRNNASSTNPQRREFGQIRNENAMGGAGEQNGRGGGGGGAGGQQQASIFENFNRQLLANGFPRFEVGPWVVEPIVSVGIILATLFLGFKGLLLGLFLFVIVNVSNSSNGQGGHFSQIISSFFGGSGANNNNNNNQAANRRR